MCLKLLTENISIQHTQCFSFSVAKHCSHFDHQTLGLLSKSHQSWQVQLDILPYDKALAYCYITSSTVGENIKWVKALVSCIQQKLNLLNNNLFSARK